MNSTPKLFLTQNNDCKFEVVNEKKMGFGGEYEIPDAIRNARLVTSEAIDMEDDHAGNHRYIVPSKPEDAISDTQQFIATLAELAGVKVVTYYDDNIHFLGYGIMGE